MQLVGCIRFFALPSCSDREQWLSEYYAGCLRQEWSVPGNLILTLELAGYILLSLMTAQLSSYLADVGKMHTNPDLRR